ncbi:hypothetical protein RUM44_006526 [Polyplax serrata]|uniref:Uncharacterized protein n=1 Tax=Polyplax serrata TaxID=468196 RepID=A0ABR1AIC4_POLSC
MEVEFLNIERVSISQSNTHAEKVGNLRNSQRDDLDCQEMDQKRSQGKEVMLKDATSPQPTMTFLKTDETQESLPLQKPIPTTSKSARKCSRESEKNKIEKP